MECGGYAPVLEKFGVCFINDFLKDSEYAPVYHRLSFSSGCPAWSGLSIPVTPSFSMKPADTQETPVTHYVFRDAEIKEHIVDQQ